MRRACALLLIPLAAACVKPPPQTEPDPGFEIAAEYGNEAADTTEPTAEWWHDFDEPALDELIALALERNRDLQAAAARVEQAAALARIAGADLKPTLGVGLNGSRQKTNFAGFGVDFPPTTTTVFNLSVDAAWEADLWGRVRAGARAAVADWQAADALVRGAKQSVAAQTARTWFAIAEARLQLELAQESAKSFADSTAQVRRRFLGGVRPALDLRLALSNQAAAEALVARRRGQLDSTVRRLEILLGNYPSAQLLTTLPEPRLPSTTEPPPVGLPADLIARRPDLVAAERRLAAADQRWRQARRSLYPRLTLTASGGTRAEGLGDLLDGDFSVWSIVGNLVQPLFQGGRLRAGVDLTAAGIDEALADFAGTALQAFAEVESALAAEEFLADEEQRLAETAEQLVAARGLAEERYRQGVGTYLIVLESQSRALAAEGELISVQRRRVENRIGLHLALGGGFESEPKDGTS
ncbi:MAG: efflux transporter outer membrane subunit [bacterium]|nr:efflux transporter outer membrane subunit [bacterium]